MSMVVSLVNGDGVLGWPLVDEFSLMARCFLEKTSLLKNKGVYYA